MGAASTSTYRHFRIFLRNVKYLRTVARHGGSLFDEKPVEVWMDGNCPLCRRSMAWCEARDPDGRIRFHDFQAASDEELPVERGAMERSMWVRGADGSLLEGFDAWRRILLEVPGWRWLAGAVALPPLRWLGPPVYRLVAHNRHRLKARGALPILGQTPSYGRQSSTGTGRPRAKSFRSGAT